MIDIHEIEKKLDACLEKETKDTLLDFLFHQRLEKTLIDFLAFEHIRLKSEAKRKMTFGDIAKKL